MERAGTIAIALAVLIIIGSLLFALLMYRSKKSKIDFVDEDERETSLLIELQEIAQSADLPDKTPPLYIVNASNPEYAEQGFASPQMGTAARSSNTDTWAEWATKPSITPET